MIVFLRARGLSLAVVVLVMFLIAVMQAGISYSVGRGPLHELEPTYLPAILAGLYVLRIALLFLLVTLWTLNRKHALFRTIIAANAYFTLILVLDTIALIGVLGGFRQAAQALLVDAALMCVSNILVFSIWYWIIDPPGVEDEPHEEAPYAFLFPQRDRSLQYYESWSPDYADYLFIAFTTSFAFSPTDALPLTRTAKMLMLVQASVRRQHSFDLPIAVGDLVLVMVPALQGLTQREDVLGVPSAAQGLEHLLGLGMTDPRVAQ